MIRELKIGGVWHVYCDEVGCNAIAQVRATNRLTASTKAVLGGWELRHGKLFCPTHTSSALIAAALARPVEEPTNG